MKSQKPASPVGGIATVALLTAILSPSAHAQLDKNISPQMAAALGWVNVQTAYGAIPNDGKDDTAAIQRAISENIDNWPAPTLYFPNGTYNLSNSLRSVKTNGYWFPALQIQGQSRNGTIFRLKNRCAGFTSATNPKAVIVQGSGWGAPEQTGPEGHGGGNNGFQNAIHDLTIDVGTGNPGAIGIDLMAHNGYGITNITIKSSDPNRVGHAGLGMERPWPGPCMVKNVRIIGFDYGISSLSDQYSVTFKDITLENQRIAGIRNDWQTLLIQNLTSNQSLSGVPVLINSQGRDGSNTGGRVILVNGTLTGGSTAQPAIDHRENGFLYLRNLTASGYRTAVKAGANDVAGARIGEYFSLEIGSPWPNGIQSAFPSPSTMLKLPIQNPPEYWDSNLANCVKVTDYGATPNNPADDDGAAIQAAIDACSGSRKTVLVPRGEYHIRNTIYVRGNARHLFGGNSWIKIANGHTFTGTPKPMIVFQNGSESSVTIERLTIWAQDGANGSVPGATGIQHSANRDLFLNWSATSEYRNTASATGRYFLENNAHGIQRLDYPQDAWFWALNSENISPMVINNGGNVWILGLKTEGTEFTAVKTTGGGKSELLGGWYYNQPQSGAIPLYEVDNAAFSAIGLGHSFFPLGLKEKRGSETRTLFVYSPYVTAFAGTTLVTNPSFDADNFDYSQTPLGWQTWSNGNYDADYTDPYHRTGARSLVHWKQNTAYQVYTFQDIRGLTNGLYTLRAWVQSSGGQNVVQMGAENYGGSWTAVSIPTNTSSWTLVTLPHIAVTNGQCRIGFWSDSPADKWIAVEDVEFFKQ